MTISDPDLQVSRSPLRLWPGLVAGLLLLLSWFVLPVVLPDAMPFDFFGGFLGAAGILVWWVFFSRAPRLERWGAVPLIALALWAASRLLHESIATGMRGMMFFVYSIPVVSLALLAWAVAARRLSTGPRRAVMAATILLACGVWTILRTHGVTGDGKAQLDWRWNRTPEERLLARAGESLPAALPPGPAASAPVAQPAEKAAVARKPEAPAQRPVETAAAPAKQPPPHAAAAPDPAVGTAGRNWPGFRGPDRDSRIAGIRIGTDWSASPPVELWRRPVGPGWSSFAVRGDMLYTQEQRGEHEVVAGYNATTGKPVWEHQDAARFWESNGGAGPRATPTLAGGRLYSMGATGILNALDAADGSVLWSRTVPSDTGAKVPYWGLSSSPLVVDGLVIVYAGKLAAYDAATGQPRWFGPDGGVSYSSPQLLAIGGVAQVVMLCNSGALGAAPGDGALLWQHPWGSTIVQPARTTEGDLLISAMGQAGGIGTRRLAVARASDGWKVEERWTSTALKPYFNDFVVHNGHAYGFDGSILACIVLQDGTRKWKGGRYGHGQLILLSDQDLLLVLSEEGELALVAADPAGFRQIARMPAIEGKTWNHPVLAGDVLLVRNGQEMVAFRMPVARE